MAKLIGFGVLLAIGMIVAWSVAGRARGPGIAIVQPTSRIGQTGELSITVEAPGAKLKRLEIALEQGGQHIRIFDLSSGQGSTLLRENDRLRIVRSIGKEALPQLKAGPARILVAAARPVLFGLREAESTATRDFEVLLSPPRLSVVSTFHYINRGGSEMIVYRVSPANADSGVHVGDYAYPGYPAPGARVGQADDGLRLAFFALLWNQDVSTPIELYAHDDVGNESRTSFDYRVLSKTFRQSRIQLDDRFLARVVPAILQRSTQVKVENPADLLGSFLRINGDLRRENDATIAALARSSAAEVLWDGPFKQLVNTAVEGGFADQRTYLYHGQVVDHQVHLGFDLASVVNAPVQAANHGRVAYAGWLGIYGDCVIVDHGMGVQSLYAHLSSIAVKTGDLVSLGQVLGYTGSTGLAGGDHLHFTVLVGGNPVTPVDWWSAKWIKDRILRKMRDAAAQAGTPSVRVAR